jgi:hypothetical protein
MGACVKFAQAKKHPGEEQGKKESRRKILMNLERVLSAKRWASAAKAESFPGPTRCRLTVGTTPGCDVRGSFPVVSER